MADNDNESIREASQAFEEANKLARKARIKALSKGFSGYLPCFEDKPVKAGDMASEVDLGIIDISLRKIIGTKSRIRFTKAGQETCKLLLGA